MANSGKFVANSGNSVCTKIGFIIETVDEKPGPSVDSIKHLKHNLDLKAIKISPHKILISEHNLVKTHSRELYEHLKNGSGLKYKFIKKLGNIYLNKKILRTIIKLEGYMCHYL